MDVVLRFSAYLLNAAVIAINFLIRAGRCLVNDKVLGYGLFKIKNISCLRCTVGCEV